MRRRGPGPPANRREQRGGGGALRHPSLLQKFKPDWGWRAAGDRRPHRSPLAEDPLGWGWQVLLAPHGPCFLPRTLASPSTRRDKDPGLPVCAPQRQLERRGWARALGQPPPTLWAKLGWKHSDRPGCQLPVPSLGNELLAAPHDSSPGLSPRASRPPPCSAPVGCQEAHVTPGGGGGPAPPDPFRSGAELGGTS